MALKTEYEKRPTTVNMIRGMNVKHVSLVPKSANWVPFHEILQKSQKEGGRTVAAQIIHSVILPDSVEWKELATRKGFEWMNETKPEVFGKCLQFVQVTKSAFVPGSMDGYEDPETGSIIVVGDIKPKARRKFAKAVALNVSVMPEPEIATAVPAEAQMGLFADEDGKAAEYFRIQDALADEFSAFSETLWGAFRLKATTEDRKNIVTTALGSFSTYVTDLFDKLPPDVDEIMKLAKGFKLVPSDEDESKDKGGQPQEKTKSGTPENTEIGSLNEATMRAIADVMQAVLVNWTSTGDKKGPPMLPEYIGLQKTGGTTNMAENLNLLDEVIGKYIGSGESTSTTDNEGTSPADAYALSGIAKDAISKEIQAYVGPTMDAHSKAISKLIKAVESIGGSVESMKCATEKLTKSLKDPAAAPAEEPLVQTDELAAKRDEKTFQKALEENPQVKELVKSMVDAELKNRIPSMAPGADGDGYMPDYQVYPEDRIALRKSQEKRAKANLCKGMFSSIPTAQTA